MNVIVISEMHDEDIFSRALESAASAKLRKHEIARDLPAAVVTLANV